MTVKKACPEASVVDGDVVTADEPDPAVSETLTPAIGVQTPGHPVPCRRVTVTVVPPPPTALTVGVVEVATTVEPAASFTGWN